MPEDPIYDSPADEQLAQRRVAALERLAETKEPVTEVASVVYILGSPGSHVVKIGTTTRPDQRIKDIQTMSPVPIEVLALMPGGRAEEAALHRHFSGLRTHGEWFDFGESDPLSTIQAAIGNRFQIPVPVTVTHPDCATCGHTRERHNRGRGWCKVASYEGWTDCECQKYQPTPRAHGVMTSPRGGKT